MRRNLLTLAAAAATSLVATLAAVTPVSASERDHQVNGANIRVAADPYSTVIGLGHRLRGGCQRRRHQRSPGPADSREGLLTGRKSR